jgi:pantetheine-phosphate adenylyltransferase
MFSAEERKAFIEDALSRNGVENVEVAIFTNLLVELRARARRRRDREGAARDLGLRVRVRDEPAEPQAGPEIESIYIIASPDYSFLSSTGVKEMATFGGDVSDLVPLGARPDGRSAEPLPHTD